MVMASGNALALMVVPNPGGERTAESFNGDAALAPLLHVEFVPEPSSMTLVILGVAALVASGRRRRRSG